MNPGEFGRYLKTLREEKGLTLTELSKLSGTSHPYLSQIENGRKGVPSSKVLKKLSEPLAVPYMELMYKAGHVEYPPAAVDFMSGDIERISFYFSDIRKKYPDALEQLEAQYQNALNGKSITPETLKSLLYEEPPNPDITNLIGVLKEIIEMMKEEEELASKIELKDLLGNLNKIYYNGHCLTTQDQKRILSMLETLFPEYS